MKYWNFRIDRFEYLFNSFGYDGKTRLRKIGEGLEKLFEKIWLATYGDYRKFLSLFRKKWMDIKTLNGNKWIKYKQLSLSWKTSAPWTWWTDLKVLNL
jgi:hypothetical protein